jgi:hypothetical protein
MRTWVRSWPPGAVLGSVCSGALVVATIVDRAWIPFALCVGLFAANFPWPRSVFEGRSWKALRLCVFAVAGAGVVASFIVDDHPFAGSPLGLAVMVGGAVLFSFFRGSARMVDDDDEEPRAEPTPGRNLLERLPGGNLDLLRERMTRRS